MTTMQKQAEAIKGVEEILKQLSNVGMLLASIANEKGDKVDDYKYTALAYGLLKKYFLTNPEVLRLLDVENKKLTVGYKGQIMVKLP